MKPSSPIKVCEIKSYVSIEADRSSCVKGIMHQPPPCYEARSLLKLIFFKNVLALNTHCMMEKEKPNNLKVIANPFHNSSLSYFLRGVTRALLSLCCPASLISASRGRKAGKDNHCPLLHPSLLHS